MGGKVGVSFRVYTDLAALSQAAAREIVAVAKQAITDRGRFTIALAGGRTPGELYRLLASTFRDQIDWSKVYLFWGDERYLPAEGPHSNVRMAEEYGLLGLPIPVDQVFPMPVGFRDPADAAQAYEQTLRTHFGNLRPIFDLVLLGMGADGHSGSLFPGNRAVDERVRWVTAVYAEVEWPVRLSLTIPVLAQARRALFMVSGREKGPVWREIVGDAQTAAKRYPAAMVNAAGNALWFVDKAAHGSV